MDSQGAASVTGATNSRFFPLLAPISTPFYSNTSCDRNPGATSCNGDAFVSKLSSAGNSLVYSTFVGGQGTDYANAIALDSGGNAYIAGFTTSTDLPTVNAYQSTTYGTDILLAKLAWNGTTLSYAYSTYFGGNYYDEAYAIAVDSAGSAYLTGTAYSLPNTCQLAVTNVCGLAQALNGDAFVSKFSPSGTALLASVYVGGNWRDTGQGLALDSAGNVYIGGDTDSTNFPVVSAQQTTSGGLQDGFITRLNWNGSGFSYGYSTYVGGSSYDGVLAIAVSGNGTATATGSTQSSNFPNACLLIGSICGIGGPPGGVNAFALQLASGGSLNYTVYLDGSGNEYGRGIALDSSGQVYLTGDTSSSNFSTQSPIQGSNGGGTDAFVTKISTPATPPATRTISYQYDGLLRLIGASENPGFSYGYAYDEAGNRTDTLVNGIPTEPHRNYNAANQVIGWTYDEAGNLRGDGTWNYTYDALNRLVQTSGLGQTHEYSYNGDGALTMQAVPNTSTSTRYIQDLAAPLSQVLQSSVQGGTTTTYLYGLKRLAAANGMTKTWYVSDALSSVRRTLSSAGTPGAPINYDPWGTPEYGATPPTFGFTGELQDVNTGLVYLRARWYHTGRGTFTSRDPFAGFPEQPYSLHPYQYAYNNPVLLTDPSGKNPFPMGPVHPLEGVYIGAIIAAAFMAGKPGDRWAEYPVPGASTNPNTQNRLSINGFADLVDFSNGEVYEVKSRAWHLSHPGAAQAQLDDYVVGLNRAASRTASTIEEFFRPRPATGTWIRGTTFLTGGAQSFGLWPFGIDPTYDPKIHGYYELKASMSSDTGVIVYWGDKISEERARQLVPRYRPDEVLKFIEVMYRDPYGLGGNKDWRQPKWGSQRPQLYPGLNMFDAGYWCAVTGDMIKYYYEELGRLGNQLGPAQPGMVPGIPGPGYIPVPVP